VDWWASNPADWKQLALELTIHTKVLFVNTVSPSIPKKFLSRNFMRRVLRKLPSYLKLFRKVKPNLYVFTPITIFTSNPGLTLLNHLFLKLQIYTLKLILQLKKPIIWVSNPTVAPIVEHIDKRVLIYGVTDKFDETRYIQSHKTIRSFDKMLTKQADIILCVSHKLERLYRKRVGKRARYLPHAVDYEHFRQKHKDYLPIPKEISRIPHPIIGYYGSLTDSNNLEWIEYCAEKHPEWSFLLIGRVMHDDVHKLGKKYKNVYLLGFVDYDHLPLYARHFDVCLLFWKMTKWIKYCNPYKTREYLAMGKPVVSVPIPEIVEEYSKMIATANTAEEFCYAIEKELISDNRKKAEARMAKVQNDTWANYIKKVQRMLEELSEE